MAGEPLLHRIRWANVAGAVVVLGCLTLVLAWPRLAPRTLEPPPSALLEARAPAIPPAGPPGEALGPPAPTKAPVGFAPGPSSVSDPDRGRSPGSRDRRGGAEARRSAVSRRRRSSRPPSRAGRSGVATRRSSSSADAEGPGAVRRRVRGPRPRRSRLAPEVPRPPAPAPPPRATTPPAPRAGPPPTPPPRVPPHQAQREFGPARSEFPRRP